MKLITLEGCDGVGKTSQALALTEALNNRGYKTYRSSEPLGAPVFDDYRFGIKQLLYRKGAISADSEVLWYLMSRYEHIRYLESKREELDFAILDRFADSTEAYQCYGLGFDPKKLITLQSALGINMTPDITLILDADYDSAANRQKQTLDGYYYESLGRSFYDRTRQGFLAIAKQSPQRVEVIDASKPFDEVSALIIRAIDKRLGVDL